MLIAFVSPSLEACERLIAKGGLHCVESKVVQARDLGRIRPLLQRRGWESTSLFYGLIDTPSLPNAEFDHILIPVSKMGLQADESVIDSGSLDHQYLKEEVFPYLAPILERLVEIRSSEEFEGNSDLDLTWIASELLSVRH